MRRANFLMLVATAAWSHAAVATATAQSTAERALNGLDSAVVDTTITGPFSPDEVQIVVSVEERRLWVIANGRTLRSGPVSVASGRELEYAGRRWRFATPRGELRVRGKRTDPVWLPPDWHYAEVASRHGLALRTLTRAGAKLRDGSRLVVRDSVVGIVQPGDTTFLDLPVNEHIVFDSTLFIPPVGTQNRRLSGELGKYALDLGNGYMLHGTPEKSSIGYDVTHGCIRLTDEDLEWLYTNVPVGATVYVK